MCQRIRKKLKNEKGKLKKSVMETNTSKHTDKLTKYVKKENILITKIIKEIGRIGLDGK